MLLSLISSHTAVRGCVHFFARKQFSFLIALTTLKKQQTQLLFFDACFLRFNLCPRSFSSHLCYPPAHTRACAQSHSCMHTETQMHTNICTAVRTYAHTHARTLRQAYTDTQIETHLRIVVRTYAHTRTRTYAHSGRHTDTGIQTNLRTTVRTHSHARTRTYVRTLR